MLLKTKRLLLRGLEPEDLDFLYRIENNTAFWQVSNTLTPYTRFVLKQYLEQSHLDIYTAKQLRLVIAFNDKPSEAIGAIDLFDFDPFHMRAGVGIVIQEDNQKNGFASEALDVLIGYCFNHLKLHQIYCNITSSNVGSKRLFENKDFELIGVKKDWTRTADGWKDELQYQLITNVTV